MGIVTFSIEKWKLLKMMPMKQKQNQGTSSYMNLPLLPTDSP